MTTDKDMDARWESFLDAFARVATKSPPKFEKTEKALKEIANEMAREDTLFNQQLLNVRKALSNGCRRTKGRII